MKTFLTSPNRLEQEILRAHVLNKPREFLIAHPELKISKIQEIRYTYLLWKLRRGYPLAYLIGHREFYGLDFLVNKHTLIPRPETELMVELVSEKIKKSNGQMITLIDVGTGSGCIPISIIWSSGHLLITTYATDISRGALKVAKKNAKKHNAAITFLHGNLLEPIIKKSSIFDLQSEILITANLPYLTQNQFDSEPSIQKEPYSALVANDNGLALYKELLEQIKSLITSYQLPITLYMEIDPAQTESLTSHCKEQFPQSTINIHKDLLGHDRIISLTL